MNSITLAGNIGRDAELKQVGDGSVASFTMACKTRKKDEVLWYRVSVWGKQAEAICQYLTKGKFVAVRGAVTEHRMYESNGKRGVSIEVRADDVTLGPAGESRDAGRSPAKRSSDDDDMPF